MLHSKTYHSHQRNSTFCDSGMNYFFCWTDILLPIAKPRLQNWLQRMVYLPSQTQEKVFRNLIPSSFSPSTPKTFYYFLKWVISWNCNYRWEITSEKNSYLHSFFHRLPHESQHCKHSENCHLCLCTVHYYRSGHSVNIHQYLKDKPKIKNISVISFPVFWFHVKITFAWKSLICITEH